MNINKVWQDASQFVGQVVKSVGGTLGILFVEREGAVAALYTGVKGSVDQDKFIAGMKMFRDRLDKMIEKAEAGELQHDNPKKLQCYIHDEETGEFHEKTEDNPRNN